jgi:hypothetical protein
VELDGAWLVREERQRQPTPASHQSIYALLFGPAAIYATHAAGCRIRCTFLFFDLFLATSHLARSLSAICAHRWRGVFVAANITIVKLMFNSCNLLPGKSKSGVIACFGRTSVADLFFSWSVIRMARTSTLALQVLVALLCLAVVSGQFFVNLNDKKDKGAGADVAKAGEAGAGDVAAGGEVAGGDQQAQLQEEWTAFVKWFRSNGGIISSKLTVKVRC